jgi:ketosteroid isomerase-like protein
MKTMKTERTKTPDPQLRQQLDAKIQKYNEAFNKNDAGAVAAFFTEDAVFVTDKGAIYGREAIEKYFADLFQNLHFSNHLDKADQYSPHIIGTAGNEMWSNGEWSLILQAKTGDPIPFKGYWSEIYVREGDSWKVRMQMWNITPAPAPPAETK